MSTPSCPYCGGEELEHDPDGDPFEHYSFRYRCQACNRPVPSDKPPHVVEGDNGE